MTVTQKPVVDYFVMATHYVRFLRKYAGLTEDSRIVDIGCSWGYLGFALANVLSGRGSVSALKFSLRLWNGQVSALIGSDQTFGLSIWTFTTTFTIHQAPWRGVRFPLLLATSPSISTLPPRSLPTCCPMGSRAIL